MTTESVWESKRKETKAIRNYCRAFGIKDASTKQNLLEEVQKSDLGMDGWAETTLTYNVSPGATGKHDDPKAKENAKKKANVKGNDDPNPKPKPKPKKKAKENPDGGEVQMTAKDLESKLRVKILESEITQMDLQKIVNAVSQKPGAWLWLRRVDR